MLCIPEYWFSSLPAQVYQVSVLSFRVVWTGESRKARKTLVRLERLPVGRVAFKIKAQRIHIQVKCTFTVVCKSLAAHGEEKRSKYNPLSKIFFFLYTFTCYFINLQQRGKTDSEKTPSFHTAILMCSLQLAVFLMSCKTSLEIVVHLCIYII